MHASARAVARIIGDSYNHHVAQRPPTDFWGQVKRHVFGRPIADAQIRLIVAAIEEALLLQSDDVLLDLACGNGALSHEFHGLCAGSLGVDVSEELIGVAARYFAAPGHDFLARDAADYVLEEARPERFTTVLCYGSFPYFHPDSARLVLSTLARRFTGVQRVFIGNLPDLDRLGAFYPGRAATDPGVTDPLAELGIWRTAEEFIALAAATGWSARLTVMPPDFYAAHYRYDALLTRPGDG